MIKNDFVKNNQGFTLIEILISLSIFSLLVFAISVIYVAFNNSQMRTTTSQQLLNDSQYAFELMAREIRTSSIVNYSPDPAWCNSVLRTVTTNIWDFEKCIILEKANGQIFALTSFQYNTSDSSSELRYITLSNCDEDYICDNWQSNSRTYTRLLAPNLNNISLDGLDFYITPSSDPFIEGGDNQQPKVTINMLTSYDDPNKVKNVKHTFQTTVSSRVYKR